METARLLNGLAGEFGRLRAAASRDLAAPVPTCPGWTVTDLVRHVANLYGNVVVGRFHEPEQDIAAGEPLAALDRCYAAMSAEFAGREPGQRVGSLPHETVFYWIRRMLHETAIHRVDAEYAVGVAIEPLADDLALDGVDELLNGFLGELTRLFPDEFAAQLSDWDGRYAVIASGRATWRITVRPDRAQVAHGGGTGAAALIEGAPAALLYWLYNRADDASVSVTGDPALVAQLRRLVTAVSNTG
jgi:hypothetical protein